MLFLFVQPGFTADVTIHRDIAYKSGENLDAYERERCALDLYLPADASGFPLMVWFHGGALRGGDKAAAMQAEIASSLAARGIGVASVNYRLSPRVNSPAYVEDAAASVAWVLEHIGDYQGDVDNVFVSGHSAGGYLAAMVGANGEFLAAHGYELADLAGMIPVSGQMITHSTIREEHGLSGERPIIDAAAPLFHVSPDVPPWLAIAGSEDEPARAEENDYFIAALKAVGHRDATYLEFDGRTHGTIVSRIPRPHDPVADAIVNFIAKHSR
jgi:acetyl esterase/lipase